MHSPAPTSPLPTPTIYSLLCNNSWALDSLSGRIKEATRPDAVERTFTDNGGAAAVSPASSPRIGAVGSGRSAAAAAGAFDNLEALGGPGAT